MKREPEGSTLIETSTATAIAAILVLWAYWTVSDSPFSTQRHSTTTPIEVAGDSVLLGKIMPGPTKPKTPTRGPHGEEAGSD